MPRGIVLAFPSPQGLTRDDLEGLQRSAVISWGARIDILSSRKRRTVAILALAGRQLWIERDEATLRAREVTNGRQLAAGADVSRLLAAVQAALLPGGRAVWGGLPALISPEGVPLNEVTASHGCAM